MKNLWAQKMTYFTQSWESSIKVLSPQHCSIMLKISVLLAPLCPHITALHCFGEQLPSPPTLTYLHVMRAGMFLLDSTYLTIEIVLRKTAGPNTVSRPHFLPEGVAKGWACDPSPESSSGILQLETKRIRTLFSLVTKQGEVSQELLAGGLAFSLLRKPDWRNKTIAERSRNRKWRKCILEICLVVQRSKLWGFNAEGAGSTPGQRRINKILHMWPEKKIPPKNPNPKTKQKKKGKSISDWGLEAPRTAPVPSFPKLLVWGPLGILGAP